MFVSLYHFVFRSYSPTLGRWLQRAPLGYVDGSNLHEYVLGDPVGRIDRFGLHDGGPSHWKRWPPPPKPTPAEDEAAPDSGEVGPCPQAMGELERL